MKAPKGAVLEDGANRRGIREAYAKLDFCAESRTHGARWMPASAVKRTPRSQRMDAMARAPDLHEPTTLSPLSRPIEASKAAVGDARKTSTSRLCGMIEPCRSPPKREIQTLAGPSPFAWPSPSHAEPHSIVSRKLPISRRDRAQIGRRVPRRAIRFPSSLRTDRYSRFRSRIRRAPCPSPSGRGFALRPRRPSG